MDTREKHKVEKLVITENGCSIDDCSVLWEDISLKKKEQPRLLQIIARLAYAQRQWDFARLYETIGVEAATSSLLHQLFIHTTHRIGVKLLLEKSCTACCIRKNQWSAKLPFLWAITNRDLTQFLSMLPSRDFLRCIHLLESYQELVPEFNPVKRSAEIDVESIIPLVEPIRSLVDLKQGDFPKLRFDFKTCRLVKEVRFQDL
jgi:hypothetical protein